MVARWPAGATVAEQLKRETAEPVSPNPGELAALD
jgi:hypothetical protein